MAMARQIQRGEVVDYTNAGAAIAYHDVVPLGTKRVGVALAAIPTGATGGLSVIEIWEMPADTTMAFAVGDDLYWDVANKKLTKTVASNTYAGWATSTKATADAVAKVKIG